METKKNLFATVQSRIHDYIGSNEPEFKVGESQYVHTHRALMPMASKKK